MGSPVDEAKALMTESLLPKYNHWSTHPLAQESRQNFSSKDHIPLLAPTGLCLSFSEKFIW